MDDASGSPTNCELYCPAVPGMDSAVGVLPVAMDSEENALGVSITCKKHEKWQQGLLVAQMFIFVPKWNERYKYSFL
ncbi:MAG: hypothetical protein M1331_02100 [Candidatus Marsarchaeota archaeon]|nr:hypothetical protein [Candidatus Marsarchaeota archaeon]